MANVAVIGAQWGDEGKGKIVDWLSERAEVVVRFQGGHNAGHTLVIGNQTYKLALLPSGVVRQGKLSIIGNGVVIDPWHFLDEVKRVSEQGVSVTPASLKIANHAVLILPLHRDLDGWREDAPGIIKIGTTRRGIGPAYEDKVGRRAIRVGDLGEPDTLPLKVATLLAHHNPLRQGLGKPTVDAAKLTAELLALAPKILPFAEDVWERLDGLRAAGKRILFEGAQATMLDIDHGTYPYVTSSNTVGSQAGTGSGIGADTVGSVLGIAKAYTTRVGAGPFPTEQANEIGDLIGERGREFGTVTGRKRRCGWIETVRGKGGGIRLALPASEIRVGRVIREAEGDTPIVECFADRDKCCITPSCKLAGVLVEARWRDERPDWVAIGFGLKACAARRSVVFAQAPELLDQLVAAEVSHTLGKLLDRDLSWGPVRELAQELD